MKKLLLIIFLPLILFAENNNFASQEEVGLNITKEWIERSTHFIDKKPGPNGAIQIDFGQSIPTIVCAVLEVTDLAFESGEMINSVHSGDSIRWSIEKAVSGGEEEESKIEHLIIKPKDIGLSTSLVITTNRRTYHLIIKSKQEHFMHFVSFKYNRKKENAIENKFNHLQHKITQDTYLMLGKAPWQPIIAYNDGQRTYIEMDKNIYQSETPVLFILRGGGFLNPYEKVMVNYRIHDNVYVVDSIFDRAIMISGVGRNQYKITLIRKIK